MKSDPLVSPYQDRHRESLFEFRREEFGSDSYRINAPYMDWSLSDSYQCQAGRSALYVCELDGRIVGTQGAIHFQLKAGSAQLPSAWILDFAVRKELRRGRGIGTAIARISQEANPIRFAVDVSAAAVAFALRDGWQHICEIPLWVRPLDARRTLRFHAPWLARSPVGFLGHLLLEAVLAANLKLASRAQLRLVPTDAFDERSDAVWSANSPSYQAACVRDQAFLQWRFDRFPGRHVYERYWLYQRARVVGYLVLRLGDHNGLPAVFVVDYLCGPASMRSMLALALSIGRGRGAAIAYCATLHPSAGAAFRPLWFLRRKSGWQFMAYAKKCSGEVAQTLSKQVSWLLTMADSNLDHGPGMARAKSNEDLTG